MKFDLDIDIQGKITYWKNDFTYGVKAVVNEVSSVIDPLGVMKVVKTAANSAVDKSLPIVAGVVLKPLFKALSDHRVFNRPSITEKWQVKADREPPNVLAIFGEWFKAAEHCADAIFPYQRPQKQKGGWF